ncbi:MAG: hypothetical protein ACM3SY_12555 [Candidatus Omnitrophota bacterium]
MEDEIKPIEKPKICLIDIDKGIIARIKQKGFNVNAATFGTPLKNIPYKDGYDRKICLPNHSIPSNLHEYDIFVLDLKNKPGISYDEESNTQKSIKSNAIEYLYCKYPQTVFDPRPLVANFFSVEFNFNKNTILIVFASENHKQEYNSMRIDNYGSREGSSETYDKYSFIKNFPIKGNRFGKELSVLCHGELKTLLEKNLPKFHYEVIFEHPTIWDPQSQKNEKIDSFHPIMKNNIDEIVGFIELRDNILLFVLPQIEEKDEILIPLFENLLPELIPDLFPYSTKFLWKNHEEYWLPRHRILFEKKNEIEAEYLKKKSEFEKEIEDNKARYLFLHELITESGDKLVSAVKTYFEWLGFGKVKIMDDDKQKIKEEDLQVELGDKGLLVIEAKGIRGTSQDKECSQISKIKHRREKERNKFDVFALYIVNHQRYYPPKQRKNPPFSEDQIKDAENDERGLLTTWELFRLYNYIEQGIISKSDARESVLRKGLVSFSPSNAILCEIIEIFQNGYVIILQLTNICIKKGEELIIFSDENYKKGIIENLQVNDQDMDEACEGEVGIKLNIPVKKKSKIFIQER